MFKIETTLRTFNVHAANIHMALAMADALVLDHEEVNSATRVCYDFPFIIVEVPA